jgi:2-polyprenyl-3-methyl-5-hydroxy-6-metoxy-1,4-benzoquinol methylase
MRPRQPQDWRIASASSPERLKISTRLMASDLITACDCIHDFAEPHSTLRKLRELLKPDGTLFIIEPEVADRLEDNLNSVATMFYGFSLFHCMTQSLASGGLGLGTCLGPSRTEELVREAGFRRFEMLEIKSPVNLFYAAQP